MAGSGHKRRRVAAVMAGVMAGSGGVFALFAAVASPSAFATSQPYELYCPGTPIGDIVLNNAVVSGTISPVSPSSGGQFNLTGFQLTVAMPASIVAAAAALGNTSISGTSVIKVDATGATPADISSGTLTVNAPIPSPVPNSGVPLTVPSAPATIGPFTASGSNITLTVDPDVALSINISGNSLALTCNPYPNNTVPTGIVPSAPSGAKAAPVIATASATPAAPAAAAPAAPAPAPAPATAAPSTSPSSSSLASTGPGPDLWIVAIAGFVVLYLGSVALAVVERPRSLLRRLLHLQRPVPAPAALMAATGRGVTAVPGFRPAEQVVARTVPRPPCDPDSVQSVYPRAGDSQGLWFDGCEPGDRSRS